MSLKERLSADFKEALKTKNEIKKNVVNMARAAVKQYEVDHREELDDAGIIDILTKQVKMRKDALADFEKAGRTDLLEVYKAEIEVLQTYLPAQMTEDEVRAVVVKIMEEQGITAEKKNMGAVMKAVMPQVKGKADGGVVKKVVDSIMN
ncbi:MAG: GatB/YqeY domain-containing protein [Firmicutes bacterium]|nr:GatB/YqeY domain-containing protein [Clostridiales bacterium]MBQ4340799.1 GatB/YqeY domain-containing protein [Bacillota bacterium]